MTDPTPTSIVERLHRKSPIAELPAPAAYRQSTPAVLTSPTERADFKRDDRRRCGIGLLVVVALHVVLALVWFLTPKMRLKTNPAPEQWVQVSSVGGSAAAPLPPTAVPAGASDGSATPDRH